MCIYVPLKKPLHNLFFKIMLSINIVLLVVPTLLVLRNVRGAEILEHAPVLEEGQAAYYFIQFEQGVETDNKLGFNILSDSKAQSGSQGSQDDFEDHNTRTLKIVCRQRDGVISIDLITNPISEEDQILLDTVFVNSCEYDDVYHSVYPQHPFQGKETFIFLDEEGLCHRRTYVPKTWQFTATVFRSAVEKIDCPNPIKEMIREGTGVVKHWSPEGLALQTFFIDKPNGDKPEVEDGVSFANAPGYKMSCMVNYMKYSDSMQDEEANVLLTATVEYDGVPLDRLKLEPKTCTVENIVPETVTSDKGTKHIITFKTSKGTKKREYEVSIKTLKGYKLIYLTRKTLEEKESEPTKQKNYRCSML